MHDNDPATDLPQVTQAVKIDGTSQPGYSGSPLIEIIGDNIMGDDGELSLSYGLWITEDDASVSGLTFNDIGGPGVILSGSNNSVQADVFGTSVGSNPDPNGPAAIAIGVLVQSDILGGASNNTIGGTTAGSGNQIFTPFGAGYSGPGQTGVLIQGTNGAGADNLVEGNAITSVYRGIELIGVKGNTIGGPVAGAGNTITTGINMEGSDSGIEPIQGSDGTLIEGNSVSGFSDGVYVSDSANVTIGGTTPLARNVLSSFNTYFYPAADINVVDDSTTGLGRGVLIVGNYLGTNAAGTAPASGTSNSYGVLLDGASFDTIGGTVAGAGNLISGNQRAGIQLDASVDSGVTGVHISAHNLVQGNRIGTDVTGTHALGNSVQGILDTGTLNTIGGTTLSAANVISANGVDGVDILSDSNYGPASGTKDLVEGNFIDTDSSGTLNLANGGFGVSIAGGSNTIGGTVVGSGNTLVFNALGNFLDQGTTNVIVGNNTSAGIPADISVFAGAPAGPARVGQTVPYTFVVENLGPGIATNVELAINGLFPADAGIIGIYPSQGNLSVISTSAAFANLGTLLPDQFATVVVVVLPFKAGGNATVAAYGAWPGPDPNLSDNLAFANIPIASAPTRPATVSVKPKAVAKSVHSAKVPAPTTHFLGTASKKPHVSALIKSVRPR